MALVYNSCLQIEKTQNSVTGSTPASFSCPYQKKSLKDPRATSLETPDGAEHVHPGQSQGAERPETSASHCASSFPFPSQRATVFARLQSISRGCFPHKQCYEESLQVILGVRPKQMLGCKQGKP